MTATGYILIALGVLFTVRNPGLTLNLKRGKLRGVAGPVLVVLGILMVTGVITG